MITLTREQHESLEGGESRVLDPETNAKYVLITEETYERLHDLLEIGPLNEQERRTILRGTWRRAGWDDPRMDDYDALPEQP